MGRLVFLLFFLATSAAIPQEPNQVQVFPFTDLPSELQVYIALHLVRTSRPKDALIGYKTLIALSRIDKYRHELSKAHFPKWPIDPTRIDETIQFFSEKFDVPSKQHIASLLWQIFAIPQAKAWLAHRPYIQERRSNGIRYEHPSHSVFKWAVIDNDIEKMGRYVAEGVNVNEPLEYVARYHIKESALCVMSDCIGKELHTLKPNDPKIQCLEFLLKNGANPNQYDCTDNQTPLLHIASRICNPVQHEAIIIRLLQLLIGYGADITLRDKRNKKTAFEYAKYCKGGPCPQAILNLLCVTTKK